MYQIKRQLDVTESLIVEAKKLQTTFNKESNKTSCIEHLSNELFYEIFEYLDGCDIYKAFINLNFRFQHLITCSSLPLKIKLHSEKKTEFPHCCENVIVPNRHRIISLYLENNSFINDFFTQCIIDSSFDRLESIVLNSITINRSVVLLFHLKSLPRLFSLTMNINDEESNFLNDIYRMIFSLPSLKYNKLSLFSIFDDEDMDIFVPLAINEQFSAIEYLVIDHYCTIDQLLSILHHTPRLRHLTCESLVGSDDNINTGQSVMLSNLTYLRINNCEVGFDEFEIFLRKISSQLQILNIRQRMSEDYLDADRWERIIKKHIHHLRRFDYEYSEYFWSEYENVLLCQKLDRFISPFWIEQQCFFEVEINDDAVVYSIHPYRNTWLDIYKHTEIATYFNHSIQHIIMSKRQDTDNSATQCLPIIQLNINRTSFNERNQLFIDKFKSIFVAVQFTRLNIDCKDISIGLLVRIIHLLPNLDSLKISSLLLIQTGWLFDDDGEIRFLTSINNKITKVNLEKMIDIEQVHFILYLCLRIQYFQVNIPKDIDLEMLLRFILIKSTTYIPHLCSLNLSIPNVNDEIVHQLQKMIESEKLLTNFMIKNIYNNILLKWN